MLISPRDDMNSSLDVDIPQPPSVFPHQHISVVPVVYMPYRSGGNNSQVSHPEQLPRKVHAIQQVT